MLGDALVMPVGIFDGNLIEKELGTQKRDALNEPFCFVEGNLLGGKLGLFLGP